MIDRVRRRIPVYSLFYKGIKPDELWGKGKHTFYSDDSSVRKASGPEEISKEPDIEFNGFSVFGEMYVGDEVPEIEIYKLNYVDDPENLYEVRFSFGIEGLIRDVRTNELISPDVLKANSNLIPMFRELESELLQKDRVDLAEQVGELIARAS